MDLDNGHWKLDNFTQRMPVKQWSKIVREYRDSVIYKGNIVKLKGVRVAPDVIEVTKDFGD